VLQNRRSRTGPTLSSGGGGQPHGLASGDGSDLSGIDANNAVAGNQAFVFGGSGTGRVSLSASGNGTLVRANFRNDAAFEFELQIEDGAVQRGAYAVGDFVL
jgi:hypothetical protein